MPRVVVFLFFFYFAEHAMPVRSLAFSPDSRTLATASDDGFVKMYDM